MTRASASTAFLSVLSGAPRRTVLAVAVLAIGVSGCGDDASPGAALCRDTPVPIAAVQGSGATSPRTGETILIRGVSTAVYRGDDRLHDGYFLQAPAADHDDDPRTSEALYVVSDKPPEIGSLLAVRGEVVELGDGPVTLTAVVESARSPCGKAESKPSPAPLELPGDLESLEAMLIRVGGELTVADVYALGRAGRMTVAGGGMVFTPTEQAAPGPGIEEIARRNAARSLIIDDASAAEFPSRIDYLPREISVKTLPRVGDKVTGMVGVLDARGEYRLHAVARLEPVSRQPEQRFSPPGGQLNVGSFNLMNYFNGDGFGRGFPTPRGADNSAELERQQRKLVLAITGLGLPDILALQELENDGYGPNSAIADLVAALNRQIRASRDTYAYVAPPVERLGDDQIAVGLVYRRDKVLPVGPAATASEPPFDRLNRPPLAQTFRVIRTGEVLTVVTLHLKSKNCDGAEGADADQGDGQGCFNAARLSAVEYLARWAASDPTASEDPDLLLMGDFNAYSREDPIRALEAAGFVNLMARFHEQPRYSFVYRGQAGSLDHALASPGLADQARGARIWHINAGYTAWLDYNLEGKPEGLARTLYQASAVRSSDHDPLVVGFDYLPTTLSTAFPKLVHRVTPTDCRYGPASTAAMLPPLRQPQEKHHGTGCGRGWRLLPMP